MKKVEFSAVEGDLSRYLEMAEDEPIIIMHHGRPVGALIGFADGEARDADKIEQDPRFQQRVARARKQMGGSNAIRITHPDD